MKALSFPHPVLGFNDDVQGEFELNGTITLDSVQRKYVLELSANIINTYINGLYTNSLIKCVLKVTCSSTMFTAVYEIPPSGINKILMDEISVADELTIDAYLVAADVIKNYVDSTFDTIFKGHAFSLDKGDIVGIVQTIPILLPTDNEKMDLGSLFSWHTVKEDDPITFTFDETDQIHIYYPTRESGDDVGAILLNSSETFWVGYNIYIIPALSAALEYLKDLEDPGEHEWMSTLVEMIEDKNWRETDSFVLAQNILKDKMKASPSVKAGDSISKLISID